MIVVTGALVARPETRQDLVALCIDHARRSRAEPGCVSHRVHVDCEDELRLFFHETWTDRAALAAHFALDASRTFVREARRLAASVEGPDVVETAQVAV